MNVRIPACWCARTAADIRAFEGYLFRLWSAVRARTTIITAAPVSSVNRVENTSTNIAREQRKDTDGEACNARAAVVRLRRHGPGLCI
ncbi:MAG TPA: hypothetical protein VFT24_07085 [Vicinamibacterales bacterium]|nr:hypothetical protein [Vicinamibacterales bacterium]